jgi:hypothetical protein
MRNEFIIEEIRIKFNDVNIFWINRYVKFLSIFKLDKSIKNETQKHHILPKSIFLEYSDLNTHKWNCCILSHRAHIIAHYMLAKALGGNMWAPLYFYSKKYNFNSRIISEINKNNSINVSNRMKNKVLSLDLSTGEKGIVDYEIFNNDDNLVGWNKGNKDAGFNISKSLNRIESNGKTIAQNRALSGDKNAMFGKSGDKNPFFGKKHTDETKRKLSEGRKNTKMDDETKKKISDTLKGSKKENTDGYKKYIYILYNGIKEIYSSDDQRDISKYIKDNNLPSLFKLKKSDLLNFKFRKFIKTDRY